MGFVWTPWALVGLASAVFSCALAVVVYRARPDRLQNRLLALWLALAGLEWGLFTGVLQSTDDRRIAMAAFVTAGVFHVMMHAAHLLFLSTLPSRLVSWMARPWVRWALALAFIPGAIHMLVRTSDWITALDPSPVGAAQWVWQAGPFYEAMTPVFAVLWGFGVLAAWRAHVNRSAWVDRRQANAYLAGFAVHDGYFAIILAWTFVAPIQDPFWSTWVTMLAWPVVNIWLVATLAYGILRTQLFDIDLKVKAGLSRTTLAAVGAAFILVVSEAVEMWLDIDQFWPAIGAALLVAIALRPLRWLGDRVADAVMPGVEGGDDYVMRRKEAVYMAALAEAESDAVMTQEEQDMLIALRRRLGLSEA